MKDFAGSSITYYGLAREKLMQKYPRMISVLLILALICMTGMAIYLISDLVSFASNQDHKGVLVGLDLKGPENGIVPMTDDKEKEGNISTNSSGSLENLSNQTKKQSLANLSVSKSSSSGSSWNSVDGKSSKTSVKKHHSSSSSSSASSSSAKSAKNTNDKNNLTNQSRNNSQGNESGFVNATISVDLPQIDAANSAIANSSNISNEGQSGVLSDQESANPQRSNDSEVAPTAILTPSPSVAVSSITSPSKDTPAREPVSIIKFKTLSPKSEQGPNPDNGINADGATISDNSNKAKSSKDATKKPNSQAIRTKSASSQKKKLTATNQAAKVKETRAKLKANRDRIAENMKKKVAQSRAKAAK